MPVISSIPKIMRFRGCLIGSAVGDALGMPTENMTRQQIANKYGNEVRDFYPKPNQRLAAGQWTDDTLLTQATVDSLIEKGAFSPSHLSYKFKHAYLHRENRGFGATTKIALRRLMKNVHWNSAGVENRFAAGNGAAMRIAPLALFSYSNHDQLLRNCIMAASITHKNPDAINGSLVVAYVLARIINGTFDKGSILPDISTSISLSSTMSNKLRTLAHLMMLPKITVTEALDQLGTSGSVFDTLASSLYLFLRLNDSPEEALVQSASAGGDTDTIGAIVGALSGAQWGEATIPQRWISGVEDGEMILVKAERLYQLSHGIQASES